MNSRLRYLAGRVGGPFALSSLRGPLCAGEAFCAQGRAGQEIRGPLCCAPTRICPIVKKKSDPPLACRSARRIRDCRTSSASPSARSVPSRDGNECNKAAVATQEALLSALAQPEPHPLQVPPLPLHLPPQLVSRQQPAVRAQALHTRTDRPSEPRKH